MKIELLAPAKNKEIALEAINCGADAIYIGAANFGARKNAPNSLEDIKEVVNYAHKFWAKIFVTINTILTDSELNNAVQLVKDLDEIGTDGIIIQDLGLLNRLMDLNLNLHIHMSTQCDNYLPQKVEFFKNVGVSRVILARECSIDRIKEIHKINPDLELETFVHGALCVSFSGQCYLSQSIGGRSANRGECAQPCRKKYTVENEEGKVLEKDIYALCLKDFNASNNLDELINAGICSLKIEGRLKDKNYVKNIVAYYSSKLKNKASSGKSFYNFIPNPEKTFNRGFTEYFLKNREECFNFESPKSKGEYLGKVVKIKGASFKIDTNKKLYPQDGLYFNGDGCLINSLKEGYIFPNKKVNIKLGDKIYRNMDVQFEKELQRPVKRQIGVNVLVEKGNVVVVDEDNISVCHIMPIGEIAKNIVKMQETFQKQFSKTGESDFYIKDFVINDDIPFLPISQINEFRKNILNSLMKKRIEFYNNSIKKPQPKMQYSKYFLKEVDYRANVHNKEAEKFYNNCGCRVLEPSFEKQRPQRKVALMRCKHCIKYALNMCKSPEKLVLKDETGHKYSLCFDCKNCEMSLLG